MTSRWYPPPARPQPVDGGVKARSSRGAIGESWWSERFVTVLEDIGLGNRLQRGRSYARKGQVISFDVSPGSATAHVQGSRARPYRVRIGIVAYGKREWATIESALADNAWYAAKLLAGEMPDDIEGVFATVGTAVFPASARELSMDCSCPDWEVPCKHVAAVLYLLAEAFDADPFLILAWRGRERDELLANLRAARARHAPQAGTVPQTCRPLDECLDSYYALQGELPATRPALGASTTLLDQMPQVDLAVRGRPLAELLHPAYLALGDQTPEPPPRASQHA